MHKLARKYNYVFIAAQNCSDKKSGAYTGEVSAEMLQEHRCTDYVILGHSERREYFNESNELLSKKINICLENGLKPIFCCEEPLAIKRSRYTKTVL